MRPATKKSDELILYPNKLKWILILIGSICILILYLSVSATGTQTMLLVLQMAGIRRFQYRWTDITESEWSG